MPTENSGMRILVTGARGYLGTVLVPVLLAQGHRVEGLDAGFFEGHDFSPPPDCPWRRMDIRDLGGADLAGYEAVVHLAALSNDPLGERDPQLTIELNGTASVRLAECAREAGVRRFVLASSCSVYGALSESCVATELTPPQPLTAYSRAKVQAEEGVLHLQARGFCPTVLRFATAYGVTPRLRLDLVANNLVAWAVTTGEIRLQSDGRAWRPLVHVRDMAAAVATVLTAPAELVSGATFNVGSDEANVTISELAHLVAVACPDTRIATPGEPVRDRRTYRVSFARWTATFPQAQPTVHLSEGLRDMAAEFRASRLSEHDVTSRRFERLVQLDELERRGCLGPDLRWRAV